MEFELEDDILSQIASALENEYVALKSLDDSAENIILSQALDLDYTVSQTVETYGLELLDDVSFDLGFINADGATDKQSILLLDHANMQLMSTSHETVLEYSKLVLFFLLLFCRQNNNCLSGLCLVSDETVQTSTINDVDHKTIRFSSPVTDIDIKKLNDTKKNKNTIKNTKWAFRIFESWRESRKEDIPELHTMEKSTMAYWLTRFVMEIRNQKGEDYAGKTLYSVLCALLRHIRDRGVHNINFLDERDPAFAEFCKTVDSKMKDLLEKGVGVKTRQADPITEKDEYKLWDSGVFGMKDAQSLQHTVFFYNCKLFGLSGRDEHRHMNCDQFEVGEDSNGRYIRFMGQNSKTYQGGIGQMSLTNKDIKHYCSEGPRCLATYFQAYLDAMGNNGCFYRRALLSPSDDTNIRYSNQDVGINTLGHFMTDIAKLGGIKGNFTNHSGKRTCATALYNAGIDEQDIMDRTGHRSTAGVRKYKRASDNTRQRVSSILNPSKTMSDSKDVSDNLSDSCIMATIPSPL